MSMCYKPVSFKAKYIYQSNEECQKYVCYISTVTSLVVFGNNKFKKETPECITGV